MSALEQLLKQLADPSGIAWNEETYDLALANTLEGAERAEYAAKLIENAGQGDTHAILTLGHMRVEEALPVLRVDAAGTAPWAATSRRALVLMGHGEEVVDKVIEDALHGKARMGRVAAVMALPAIGGPKAIDALGKALSDPDSSVRMIAWNALVAALDLEPIMRVPDGKLLRLPRLLLRP
jgi:HEAT repeat protein